MIFTHGKVIIQTEWSFRKKQELLPATFANIQGTVIKEQICFTKGGMTFIDYSFCYFKSIDVLKGGCKRVAEIGLKQAKKAFKKLDCLYEGANQPVLYFTGVKLKKKEYYNG